MKGAREYASMFPSGQYGKLKIESGEHARGKTFHIYVGEVGNLAEVFGIIGGHPGWTEYYGWKHDGPWQQDFEKEVEKRREIMTQEVKKNLALKAISEKKEADRIGQVLEKYKAEARAEHCGTAAAELAEAPQNTIIDLNEHVRECVAAMDAIAWLERCFQYVPDCTWRDDLRRFIEAQRHQ